MPTTTVATTSLPESTTERTTSPGEIVTTVQPSTTTPGEICPVVTGMDEPQLVPDRFIEVCTISLSSVFQMGCNSRTVIAL